MIHRRILITVLYLLVGAASLGLAPESARADLLVPGQKSVDHALVFEGVEDHPEWDFWLVLPPGWRESHGNQKIESGRKLRFYKLLAARVMALPKGSEPEGDGPWDKAPRSAEEFHLDVTAPAAALVERRVTRLRIDGVEGELVKVRELERQEFDAQGRRVTSGARSWIRHLAVPIAIAAAALALLVGVVIVRRRRRSRP